MTTELRRWEMGDPLLILMSREREALKRSCAGCANVRVATSPFGEPVIRCLKGRPYGKKCNQFKKGEAA